MNTDLDPALLAELRELYQSERAPAALERSVLERVLPSRARAKGLLGARQRAWWSRAPWGVAVLSAAACLAGLGAVYLGLRGLPEAARDPSADERVALGPEPRIEAGGELRNALHCPLDDLPAGFSAELTRISPEALAAGLQLDTFPMPIPGCPPLVRGALSYVPRTLAVPSRAPVLLVLPEGGDSAQGVRWLQPLLHWDELAERDRFIVVYANAAPNSSSFPNSGDWQTDSSANRAVDDVAYLARVVERLAERGLVAPGGAGPDLYLLGYGSGAQLALEAAAQHPERYAGVAALFPPKINRSRPPPRRADTRLSRLLFLTLQDERPWAYWPGVPLDVASVDEWAVAVGLPRLAFRQGLGPELGSGDQATCSAASEASLALRLVVPAGTRVLDVGEPAQGGPALRVLVVQRKDAIDVGPNGSPAPLDAPTLAWKFLRGTLDERSAAAP